MAAFNVYVLALPSYGENALILVKIKASLMFKAIVFYSSCQHISLC